MKSQLQWVSVEFKCFFRNFISVFFTLIFPPFFLLLFGEIYGNDPTPMFDGVGSVDASLPGYIGMVICVTGIMSLPLSLTGYREKKILKRFKATPTTPMQIIVAQIVVNILMTVIGSILLVLIAKWRYNVHFDGNVFQFALAFLLTVLCIFSMGFVIASLMDNSKAATALANVIYFPMLFLSGATIPLETMPDGIRNIANFIPLTHGVRVMKGIWNGKPLSGYLTEILILTAISAVCIGISVAFFRWDSDHT
ncbi:MAG: ABC transporter permease [Clostridia bacterium]|nr:ABC transporter permease [Clostridia bacterium]